MSTFKQQFDFWEISLFIFLLEKWKFQHVQSMTTGQTASADEDHVIKRSRIDTKWTQVVYVKCKEYACCMCSGQTVKTSTFWYHYNSNRTKKWTNIESKYTI